jgi:hypothetical protein
LNDDQQGQGNDEPGKLHIEIRGAGRSAVSRQRTRRRHHAATSPTLPARLNSASDEGSGTEKAWKLVAIWEAESASPYDANPKIWPLKMSI